jgi:hypothetical protein
MDCLDGFGAMEISVPIPLALKANRETGNPGGAKKAGSFLFTLAKE